MKIKVCTSYLIVSNTTIDLPKGMTWDNVRRWWLKWGSLHIITDQDEELCFELDDCSFETVDFKYPANTLIRAVDDNGDPISDNPLVDE